jgi:hypothetical protein
LFEISPATRCMLLPITDTTTRPLLSPGQIRGSVSISMRPTSVSNGGACPGIGRRWNRTALSHIRTLHHLERLASSCHSSFITSPPCRGSIREGMCMRYGSKRAAPRQETP